MSHLNDYFDKIYCINLDRRPDRWDKCVELFKKCELEVERFPAIDKNKIKKNGSTITDGQLACLSSHWNILNIAKNNGFEKILIFEDDIVFDEDLDTFFESNKSDIPEDWKMLYFGGNHLNGLNHVVNNIHRMVASLTTHAYGIKCDIIPNILDDMSSAHVPIDVYYAKYHRIFPSYVLKNGDRQLIWQDTGYSDIDESDCDYTWLK